MQANLSKSRVIYSSVIEGLGLIKLKAVCSILIESFLKAGLLSEEEITRQQLLNSRGEVITKFHMTLLNVKYRSRKFKRSPIDGTQLMNLNFDLGVQRIPAIHLSSLQGIPQLPTDYYPAEVVIPLP
jgi:hypothetical protein